MMYRVALIDVFENGNYGLRCLSSSLKQHGFEVYNIFAYNYLQDTSQLPPDQVVAVCDLVKQLSPNLIGINALSAIGHYWISELASKIKEVADAPIIFGGPYPSIVPKYIIERTIADFVCVGEGEETMVDFCKALSTGQSVDNIPGIMTKQKLTYIRRDPPMDLDSLPFQSMGDKNTYRITKDGQILREDPILDVFQFHLRAGRGCPYHCSYCSNDALRSLYSRGKYIRKRSPSNVIDEIALHVTLNPKCKRVWFIDDTFPTAKSWVQEFSEEYRKRIDIPFSIWHNPILTKKENMQMLASAGMVRAIIGIESASDITRKEVFLRNETKEDFLETDRILTDLGITRQYDFLLDHPWESETELEDTVKLLLKLNRPYTINMHSCIILPGTAMAKRAIAEGLVTEDEIIDKMASDPLNSSRIFQWVKGAPKYTDTMRQYWTLLIYMTQKSEIPTWIIKLLAFTGSPTTAKAVLILYKFYKSCYRRLINKTGKILAKSK